MIPLPFKVVGSQTITIVYRFLNECSCLVNKAPLNAKKNRSFGILCAWVSKYPVVDSSSFFKLFENLCSPLFKELWSSVGGRRTEKRPRTNWVGWGSTTLHTYPAALCNMVCLVTLSLRENHLPKNLHNHTA